MSYQLTIKRYNQLTSTENQIPLEDWLAAVESDNDFSFITNEGDSASAMFEAANNFEYVTWSDGNINVDTSSPSEKLLRKMVSLANTLDAKVVGARA